MTVRTLLAFLAGCAVGFGIAWAQRAEDVEILQRRCVVELRACGLAGVESASEAHEWYVGQLERCMGANASIAATCHEMLLRERACSRFLTIPAARP